MKKKSKIWVVKLGSGLLTNRQGGVDKKQIKNLAENVSYLKKKGVDVILVSSGAISAGMSVLNLSKRPKKLSDLQACASVGQPKLMQAYGEVFSKFNLCVAQILVTYWDLDSRKLYENTQSTLTRLLALKNCIPIFNENDAISFEEIEMLNRFGDNDKLSAHVAKLAKAERLIILSGIEGLKTEPDGSGELVKRVKKLDQKIWSYAGQSQSERSVGGMISKLKTAEMMMKEGIPMVIANGREHEVLIRLLKKQSVGTLFAK